MSRFPSFHVNTIPMRERAYIDKRRERKERRGREESRSVVGKMKTDGSCVPFARSTRADGAHVA